MRACPVQPPPDPSCHLCTSCAHCTQGCGRRFVTWLTRAVSTPFTEGPLHVVICEVAGRGVLGFQDSARTPRGAQRGLTKGSGCVLGLVALCLEDSLTAMSPGSGFV
jgi:hypothetical protein